MAVSVQKRRRGDEEASRPKKKFKHIKKQKKYHSSSEDDDDEPEDKLRQRASDAPRPTSTLERKVPIREAQSKEKPKHKSILKQTRSPAKAVEPTIADDDKLEDEDVDEDDKDDDENLVDELELNTALNTAPTTGDSDDDLMDEDDEPDLTAASGSEDENVGASDSEASVGSGQAPRMQKKKRNDPDAFATSISKILGTKLTTSKRQDPLLSRSRSAAEANQSLADSKLEHKARAQIRAEKRQALEKGRVKDVLGLQTPDVDTGALVEEEKRLKKTAQRGVVKLFNAVRAAQVKGEDAMKQARSEGLVGMQKREERVNEMSKQGFLDLISSGGKKSTAVAT